MSVKKALEVAKELSDAVWGFKANDLLDERNVVIDKRPVDILEELKSFGGVFADPKYHDIPNTVANRVAKMAKAKPYFITVHASGGVKMLRAAVDNAGESKILAVTVLTSLNEEDTHLALGAPVKAKVLEYARYAVLAGVHGIVCSAKELEFLSKYKELDSLIKVTPGIRPLWYQPADDQKRTMTPAEAIELGADYLVIGRPILKDDVPDYAVERTLEEIKNAREQ